MAGETERYESGSIESIGAVIDVTTTTEAEGNIRLIERSLILCETQTFSVDESWLSRQPLPSTPKHARGLSEEFVAQEKQMIEAALRESRR